MSAITRRRNEITDFLQKWLSQVTPKYKVIFEDQHEPRPIGPYISFKLLTNFRRIGLDDTTEWNPILNAYEQVGQREFTVSIKATGQALDGRKSTFVSAVDLLGEIQWKLENPDERTAFHKNGIGISDSSEIIDTTDLEENVFVPRAVLDVRMNTEIREKLSTLSIEKVEITGSVEGEEIVNISVIKP